MPTTHTITDHDRRPAVTAVRRIDGGLTLYLAGNFRLALSPVEAARLARFINDEVLDPTPVAYRTSTGDCQSWG